MQHGERDAAGELAIGEWHRGSIAGDYFNIATVQARPQRVRQFWIHFDSRETRRGEPDQIRCSAGSGAQFEDILPEIGAGKYPGHSLLNGPSPSIRTA